MDDQTNMPLIFLHFRGTLVNITIVEKLTYQSLTLANPKNKICF